MTYSISLKVKVNAPREKVFAFFANAGNLPQWNAGMLAISESGPMHKGMKCDFVTVVLTQQITNSSEVTEFEPNELVQFHNVEGAISHTGTYKFKDTEDGGCEIICSIEFEPKSIVLNFAQPVIEEMAHKRAEGDLMMLKTILEKS
jgi:uncharacterized membrane protein